MIGQSPRRKEDERLVTGRGRFIDDVVVPGLLHLVLVRSIHAGAGVVAVDVQAARALPVADYVALAGARDRRSPPDGANVGFALWNDTAPPKHHVALYIRPRQRGDHRSGKLSIAGRGAAHQG